jgi:hypothetical protein
LVLFALNVYIVRELFTVEYTRFMGSIAGAYVSLTRQLAENWDLSWWPLWYAGIPYQHTYPPLLHWITAWFTVMTHVSPAHAYHFATAFFYCAGPVTLFWMAYRLSARVWSSFAGALMYSLFSPSVLLVESARQGVGSVFHPRRLQTLVMLGEGPHVASMALLPVAIVLVDLALRRRRPVFHVLAAMGMASVVLTNWLGAFALAMAVLSYILSRERKERSRGALQCAGLAALAYAFAARWIPPSTLATIRTNAQRIGGDFQMTTGHLKYAALLAIAVLLAWPWLEKRKLAAHLRFFLGFAFFMSSITLLYAWWQVPLVPQPDRYHLEMEMALALLAAFALAIPLGRLSPIPRVLVILSFALLCYSQIKPYHHYARDLASAIDVRDTSEYKVAYWIDHHMNGRRVFVPGSEYFWLNAFTDTPQLSGGFDQGVTNPLLPALQYQLFSGEGAAQEGELATLWLRAFGVHAVAVSGPRSTEVYKPYRNWLKFEGLLPVLWRDGDDIIYRVLPDSFSLAHAIRPDGRLTRGPTSILDVEFARAYVASLEDREQPPAEMNWTNRHHAVITAHLQSGQLLLVQVTYHPAWHALVNGATRRVTRDPIGLTLIEPECAGRCTVDLDYGYDAERLITTLISWTALIGALAWIVVPIARMRYWSHEPVPRR